MFRQEQFKGSKIEDSNFGVAISVSPNGLFTACAHKYIHYYNFVGFDHHNAFGACFQFANNFTQEFKVSRHRIINCLLIQLFFLNDLNDSSTYFEVFAMFKVFRHLW